VGFGRDWLVFRSSAGSDAGSAGGFKDDCGPRGAAWSAPHSALDAAVLADRGRLSAHYALSPKPTKRMRWCKVLARKLAQAERYVVATTEYLAKRAVSLNPADLLERDGIIYGQSGGGQERRFWSRGSDCVRNCCIRVMEINSTRSYRIPCEKAHRRDEMTTSNSGHASVKSVSGISIPDTTLAREITEFIRDTETDLLFNHSSRVYYFGAIAGKQRNLKFDPELLYAGAMFHDIGLMPNHSSPADRFEVDGANAACDFLKSRGIAQHDLDTVWTAIALHTTPGIPEYMHPVVALLTAGVEMDVLGIKYSEYSDEVRNAIVAEYPRTQRFKEDIIQAFYDGIYKKPETTHS
jgi:HD domain